MGADASPVNPEVWGVHNAEGRNGGYDSGLLV